MKKKQLFDFFDSCGIQYKNYEHEPVFTVAQSKEIKLDVPGGHTKNLFLKDDSGQLWLISAIQDTKIPLKKLAKALPAKGLRFAQPELLREALGVEPGSVTWFALINDREHKVRALLDERLFDFEYVGFHPLENDATTVVLPSDLKRFADSLGHSYSILDFSVF